MKYLLVREDEDGEHQLWARCAGVEGLFLDPVPPPREVLTLRGCAPIGALRDAVNRPEATGDLGDLCVEISDDRQPVEWWDLVDVTVIAHRPSQADAALVDIVVGAGVKVPDRAGRVRRLASPRYELFTGASISVGSCRGVDGLRSPRPTPAPAPLELIGCEPAEPLLAALRRPRKRERNWAELWALDRTARVMANHVVGLAMGGARPSVLGGTSIDITLTDGGQDRPSRAARPIWDTWYQGVPTTTNQWAPYTAQGRTEWLHLTCSTANAEGPDRSGGVHHLDGRFVTDPPGLHCAMGEALLGPGGYYGREWNALRDCLCGGFGAVPPFTLIWHHADIARQALAEVIWDPDRKLSYFEEVVELLRRYGSTVVFQ